MWVYRGDFIPQKVSFAIGSQSCLIFHVKDGKGRGRYPGTMIGPKLLNMAAPADRDPGCRTIGAATAQTVGPAIRIYTEKTKKNKRPGELFRLIKRENSCAI